MIQVSIAALLSLALLGCQSQPPPQVGSDRDSHGCIASAGYAWCQRSQQCERPWELAEKINVDNSTEAFAEYCGTPQ